MIRLRLAPFALVFAVLLSACQSAEEKAEGYFQSGVALLDEGDQDRAMIEFRNVFKYDGFHKKARQTYADLLVTRGELAEAYGQYLRLIEQYPDTVEVRQTLAELAMANGNWEEVERHGRAALALAPDQPGVRALGLALDYRAAVQQRDEPARATTADSAQTLLADLPDNLVLRRIVIDRALAGDTPQTALPDVEAALAIAPDSLEFNSMKLRLMALAEDMDGTGAQLKEMVRRFPDNADFKTALIQWYLGQQDIDGAEAFLRAQAGADDGASEGHLGVVQLLNLTRGRDAGRAELTRLLGVNSGTPNADLYGALLATMDYEDGKTDQAIAALQTLLTDAVPSDQSRKLQAVLARMLDSSGQRDAAQALVATILEADSSNVEALKLRATWHIAEDRPGEAILDLRTAQGQAPRDPQIMTLMAAAHERDGSLDLAGEQLAKAVEASANAATESLRYAQFLVHQGRPEVAARVLTDARRIAPGDPRILMLLADVYLGTNRWSEADEVAKTLRSIDTPETQDAAERLQAAILLGQNRIDEGLSILKDGAGITGGDARAVAVLVQTQVRAGKLEDAARTLAEARKTAPDDTNLELLEANLDALSGRTDAAEAGYRSVMAKTPEVVAPVQFLYGLLAGSGRADEAQAILAAGLAAHPESPALLWIQAGAQERAGDIDSAIAIYERLYALDSNNVIIANNLASMLATYRDDPASLERAQAIARRLRDATEPAFQDTYGWIEYRRGNLEEAVKYLEPAARGLPDDPLAQFHLAMVYADLGRKDAAIALFETMLELARDRTLPQIATARARLAALQAAPEPTTEPEPATAPAPANTAPAPATAPGATSSPEPAAKPAP
jgi:tetratricopeptide (TPR) repeat protein